MKKKWIIAVGVAAMFAAISTTAFAAAQSKTPAETVAGLSGRTVQSVVEERQTGKSYGQIAQEAGVLEAFKQEAQNQPANDGTGGAQSGACPAGGACLTDGACPSGGACLTDGSCPSGGACLTDGSCPIGGACVKDGSRMNGSKGCGKSGLRDGSGAGSGNGGRGGGRRDGSCVLE